MFNPWLRHYSPSRWRCSEDGYCTTFFGKLLIICLLKGNRIFFFLFFFPVQQSTTKEIFKCWHVFFCQGSSWVRQEFSMGLPGIISTFFIANLTLIIIWHSRLWWKNTKKTTRKNLFFPNSLLLCVPCMAIWPYLAYIGTYIYIYVGLYLAS